MGRWARMGTRLEGGVGGSRYDPLTLSDTLFYYLI